VNGKVEIDMSATGTGIFENELAQRIKAEFETGLAAGQSVFIASDRLLEKYRESDSVTVYLALAALQVDHDVVQHKVKKRALTIINHSEGLDRWEDAGAETIAARLQALQDLRLRLLEVFA